MSGRGEGDHPKTQPELAAAPSGLMGVILAAGKGTRIAPFSDHWPKPMLPLLGKPLIEYQIDSLRKGGIHRVLVVVGHRGEVIRESLKDGAHLGVEISYVEQKATLGIAHALAQTEQHVDAPFLLLLGDIFFIHDDLRGMVGLLGKEQVQGVLAVAEEPSLAAIRRNYVALEDENGFVLRVMEKPRHPRSHLKGCGIYLFEPNFFDAVRRAPRTAMRDEYELTDAIQIFIDDGARVRTSRIIHEDLNLTHPADLLELNLKLLERRLAIASGSISDDGLWPLGREEAGGLKGNSWVGPGVRIAESAKVERCVLMEGAVVSEGANIRDSLVFPRVEIGPGVRLERSIHLGDQVLRCP